MVRIHGISDDHITVHYDGVAQQHDGDDRSFLIGDSKRGGIIVRMRYGVGCSIGVWRADISQIDEGVRIPWPVMIENARESNYSIAVVVDCPAGTPVDVMAADEED